MSSYCFYSPEAQQLLNGTALLNEINQFAEERKKQIYVLRYPLSKDDSTYEYDNAVAMFTSGMKPCFIDLGNDEEKLEEYKDDFVDDISYLSEKFKYKEKIGRKKLWQSIFVTTNIENFDFNYLEIENASEKRLSDLISSLVIGSINDISRIDLDAESILDKVKSKIILFDTDQTGFVFRAGGGKQFAIQGLAGSGKTELLLHKLKEVYSKSESTIAFTCFNKILASSMKTRIPDFFDFMRVEKQIDWNKRLFCFHAWGSGKDPYSGMYRYICHFYGLTFGTMQAGSFDLLCKRAIEEIKAQKGELKHAFDYVFIDESQDFSDSFIELCSLVTNKKVFVAGDVFQNIFRPIDDTVFKSDLVLEKCYRTDPKNLMFSHALGMGLYENPVLRWLLPKEWDACGYKYDVVGDRAHLSRAPLRRFEDIPPNYASTILHTVPNVLRVANDIINIIDDIRTRHPTADIDDFAVIFLEKDNYIYDVIPELGDFIKARYNWKVNISHETKSRESGSFFISNVNNAKGLEFPFVICVTSQLKRTKSFRNALYTMMARSFLESHLVLGVHISDPVLASITSGLQFLIDNNYMDLRIPTEKEIENQRQLIFLDEKPTLEEQIKKFCTEHEATPRHLAKMIDKVTRIIGDEDYDDEYLQSILELEFPRTKQL